MTTVLKPGILVSLRTSMRGGVSYRREALEVADAEAPSGKEEVVRWETTRTIIDPDEHARASKTRNAVSRTVRRICSQTSFGLLCPVDQEEKLTEAMREARALVEAFNAEASTCTLSVHVLKGRIADTDEEAARAIAAEVTDLLGEMEAGVRSMSVDGIRDAARRAREMQDMLGDAQADQLGTAIEAAREAARAIVRRVGAKGEAAEVVARDLRTEPIERARFMFLDLAAGGLGTVKDMVLPGVSMQRFAELDAGDAAAQED